MRAARSVQSIITLPRRREKRAKNRKQNRKADPKSVGPGLIGKKAGVVIPAFLFWQMPADVLRRRMRLRAAAAKFVPPCEDAQSGAVCTRWVPDRKEGMPRGR